MPAQTAGPTLWQRHHNSDSSWATPSILPDLIFGKDNETSISSSACDPTRRGTPASQLLALRPDRTAAHRSPATREIRGPRTGGFARRVGNGLVDAPDNHAGRHGAGIDELDLSVAMVLYSRGSGSGGVAQSAKMMWQILGYRRLWRHSTWQNQENFFSDFQTPYGSDILLKDSYLARRSCFDFVETRG